MQNIYFVDLVFRCKREITSLPQFHGARFDAYLRFSCKKVRLEFKELATAILPFRHGTQKIKVGDICSLRLCLTDLGVEKLPLLCNGLNNTQGDGEFDSSSFELVDVVSPVLKRSIAPDLFTGLKLEPFSYDLVEDEAVALSKLDNFTFRLVSPLRLNLPQGIKPVDGNGLEILCKEDFFYSCSFALQHIVNSLRNLDEISVTMADLNNFPQTYDGEMEWVDLKYNHEKQKPYSGIYGFAKYQGKLPSLTVCRQLVAGQYVGLGKMQRFGLGFYKIDELDEIRCMDMPN